MTKTKLKTKVDIDFLLNILSVIEKFEHQGKKYLPYLNTRRKSDEAAIYEKIIIPLFTDVLGYDKHKDFNPQATLYTGTIDNWVRSREGNPLIALEALRSNASQTEFVEHRRRLLGGYFDELGAKYAVLTNGVEFEVWNRIAEKSKGLYLKISFQKLYSKFVKEGIKSITEDDCKKIAALVVLKKSYQHLDVESIYLEPELNISEELHFTNFLTALQGRMEDVNRDVLARFEYLQKEYQECKELTEQYKEKTFLQIRSRYEKAQKLIKSFEIWQKTSPVNATAEAFCMETMYVLFNRILLIRICEDKSIIQRKISNGGIKKYIEYRGYIKFSEADYKVLLKEAYQIMNQYYPHLFRTDIFDWYEIDNDILLHVLFTFNPYNFSKVDRDILGKLYEKYLNREKRKKLGEFYTPEPIIDYILHAVNYMPDAGIEGKKLIDPACGSGGFLVRATKILVDRLKKRGFDAETILRKVQENIYGFDISQFACHLAETNLFFQVIELIHEAIKSNQNFVMERFNIYQTDSLKDPKEQKEMILVREEMMDYSIDASVVKKMKQKEGDFKNGFDFIVGNPPYGDILNLEQKDAVSSKYPFVSDYEISQYFIALGMELLKNDNKLGYIVPNTLVFNIYADKFRQYMLTKCAVSQVVDLSKTSVFLDPKVRNIIMILQKEIDDTVRNSSGVKAYTYKEIKNSKLIVELKNEKSLKVLKNKDKQWIYLFRFTSDTENIIEKIESDVERLGAITRISQGLIPYDKYRGHSEEIIKKRIWHADYKKDDTYKKELRGRDVKRYYLEWNGIQWISYGNWLAAPRQPEFFTSPRVLIREITGDVTGKINATFTAEEYYNNPSIINVISKTGFNYDLKYLLAIINSSLVAYYHLHTSPKAKKGLFPKILVTDVRNIPIKPVSQEVQNQLTVLADQIIQINNEITGITIKLYDFKAFITDFDFYFGDLADVPGINVSIKSKIGKPSIKKNKQRVNLDKTSYIECRHEYEAQYLELYFKSLANTLRGKTNSEVVASIKMPKLHSQLNQILKQHEQLLKKIEKLEYQRSHIDKQIDKMVYKLYSITKKETEIINTPQVL